jgi:hypothetical protein
VIPVPVPVVRPVGNVVLERVAGDIQNSELSNLAEFCRKNLELVVVDVEHFQRANFFQVFSRQGGQIVARQVQLSKVLPSSDGASRHVIQQVV